MISPWKLPKTLCVGDREWKIRTDFRVILDILSYFSNPDYEPDEQWEICLDILYEDYENMPVELHKEAAERAIDFIDMGIRDDGSVKPHTMDWEQDAPIVIPSINRVLGQEIRSLTYMHWWTFLGAYMEIGESLFSQIINVRVKLAKGEKLEKWEKKFLKENKDLVVLKTKYTEEEQQEQERLKAILD